MKYLSTILRLLFGAVFIWSGAIKLKDPLSFADAVRNFEIVGDPIAPALALLVPCIEIVAGILTMLGRALWRGSVVVLIVSLVGFTIALASGWVRGLDISCGCFGGSGAVNYPLVIGRNIGLLAMGVAIVFLQLRKQRLYPIE